jgi:hypothetical protein
MKIGYNMEAIVAIPRQPWLNNIQSNQITYNSAARHVDQL